MKHQFRSFLAVLCMFAIMMCLPVLAFADDASSAAQKGLEAIKATGDHRYIQLPKEKSYLDEFKTRYVDFSDVLIPTADGQAVQMYGPSAPVERAPSMKGGLQMPFAFEDSTVTVVAEQNKMSCILYRNSNNKLRAGWIRDIYLGYNGKLYLHAEEEDEYEEED